GLGRHGAAVAAFACRLCLGVAGGCVVGGERPWGGRGRATATGRPVGGDGPSPWVGGDAGEWGSPLRGGNAQLLAGAVPLLWGAGLAADQQRPGAVLREPPLSRASGQRPERGVPESGVAWGGPVVGGRGDAATRLHGGGVGGGGPGQTGGT